MNSKCGVQSKRRCESRESCVCDVGFPACGCQKKKSVVYETECRHAAVQRGKQTRTTYSTQLPEIIDSTQSCISDVKAWMTNNQLQLNNDKTEMILIATKTVLNSDSVPQSINLEGSDIKFSNTVCNLGVCLDPTLFPTANLLRLSYLLS